MKKIILLVFLSGLFGVIFLLLDKKEAINSPFGWEGDFSIADTGQIQKIFLADVNGNKILLSKIKKKWLVNNEFSANSKSINLLLRTIQNLNVKSPVPKSGLDNVLRKLAATHVKVEIYKSNGKPHKIYYVGGPTPGHDGTYMLLENIEHGKANNPFVVEMKGFRGFLTPRFHVNFDDWLEKAITKFEESEIKKIELKNFNNPDESFVIKAIRNSSKLTWELYDENMLLEREVNIMAIRNFLTSFKSLNYEHSLKEKVDLKKEDLLYEIIIHANKKPRLTEIIIQPHKDKEGKVDPNRFKGIINGEKTVLLQFFVLQNVLISRSSLK